MPAKKMTRRDFLKKAGAVAAGSAVVSISGCTSRTTPTRLTLQKRPDVKLTWRERLYIASLSPKKRKAWLARKRSGKKTPSENPAKTRSLKQFLEKSAGKK